MCLRISEQLNSRHDGVSFTVVKVKLELASSDAATKWLEVWFGIFSHRHNEDSLIEQDATESRTDRDVKQINVGRISCIKRRNKQLNVLPAGSRYIAAELCVNLWKSTYRIIASATSSSGYEWLKTKLNRFHYNFP